MISKLSFILSLFSEHPLHFFRYGTPSSPLSSLLTPQPSPVGPESAFFPRPRGEIGVLRNPDCHLCKYSLAYHIQLHLIRFYQSAIFSWPPGHILFAVFLDLGSSSLTLSNTVLTLGDLVYMSMTLPIPRPFNLLNFCPPVIFPSLQPIAVIKQQSLHNLNFMHPPIVPSYPLAWSQLSSDPMRTFNQLIPPPFTVAHPFDVLTPSWPSVKFHDHITWRNTPSQAAWPHLKFILMKLKWALSVSQL